MKNLSLRSEIKRKSYLKIYSLFEYLLFDHFATMGAERRLGALPPATRSGASPVDANARTGSDYGFKSQVSSRRGRLRTRTAQPDCDVAENLQIVTLKFGHVKKKV